MATSTATVTSFDASNTTGFRALGTTIAGVISGTGLTQTSDTGQINWTTVTYSTSSGNYGYEVYRFGDSLQSTAPVFLKFTYGLISGTFVVTALDVGTGSNGSGTITGTTQSLTPIYGTGVGASGTGSWVFRACYNNTLGSFSLTQWDDTSTASTTGVQNGRCSWAVSRACDASGAATGSGTFVQSWGANNSYTNGLHYVLSNDGLGSFSYTTPASGWNSLTSLQVGTTVQFQRQIAPFPTLRTIPQVLYYAIADIPARGTTVTLSPYGTSYTYMCTGQIYYGSPGALAVLWQ